MSFQSPWEPQASDYKPQASDQKGHAFTSFAASQTYNIASNFGNQYLDGLNQQIKSYVHRTGFKYYFTLSNEYVLGKLRLVLFPFTQRGPWQRTEVIRNGDISFECPAEDVFAPDLYIPAMALLTHVVLDGLDAGRKGTFDPAMLSITTGSNVSALILLACITIPGLFVLHIPVKSLDLLAYLGYMFVGIAVNQLAYILLGPHGFLSVMMYTSLMCAAFMLRTLRPSFRQVTLMPDDTAYASLGQKNMYYLAAIVLLQMLTSVLLSIFT